MALKIRLRINLPRYNKSADDAALNHAAAKTTIPTRETTNTPDDAEDQENPVEQDDWEDGQVSPDEQAANKDSEESNYLPPSEDEVSLGDEDFIVPEEPLE